MGASLEKKVISPEWMRRMGDVVTVTQVYANCVRLSKTHVFRLTNPVSLSKPGFFSIIFGIAAAGLRLQKVDRLLGEYQEFSQHGGCGRDSGASLIH